MLLLLLVVAACHTAEKPPHEDTGGDTAEPDTDSGPVVDSADDTGDCVPEQNYPVDTGPPDTAVGTETGFVQVAIYGTTCSLRANGSITCFPEYTDAGEGPPEGVFTQIGMARDYGCALDEVGEVACWGEDAGSFDHPPPGPFVDLSAQDCVACVLDAAGAVRCWGALEDCTPDIVIPGEVFVDIESGNQSTCGITIDGGIACWGDDLGEEPPAVEYPVALGCGGHHCCALSAAGEAICWGAYDPYCIHDEPDELFVDIDGGDSTVCGITREAEVRCWGRPDAEVVDQAPTTGAYKALGMRGGTACAITAEDARLVCWGDDSNEAAFPP